MDHKQQERLVNEAIALLHYEHQARLVEESVALLEALDNEIRLRKPPAERLVRLVTVYDRASQRYHRRRRRWLVLRNAG